MRRGSFAPCVEISDKHCRRCVLVNLRWNYSGRSVTQHRLISVQDNNNDRLSLISIGIRSGSFSASAHCAAMDYITSLLEDAIGCKCSQWHTKFAVFHCANSNCVSQKWAQISLQIMWVSYLFSYYNTSCRPPISTRFERNAVWHVEMEPCTSQARPHSRHVEWECLAMPLPSPTSSPSTLNHTPKIKRSRPHSGCASCCHHCVSSRLPRSMARRNKTLLIP